MATYGYARISSKGQNSERQLQALKTYVEDRKIYQDEASGKDFEREGFQHLIKALDQGDILYIHSIDRLGRNKDQIKCWLDHFKKEGITLKVLDIPTTLQEFPKGQEWAQDMVNNILLEVYTSLAEKERTTIKQRQAEGIAIAKASGKYTGGTRKNFIDSRFIQVYSSWKRDEITAVEASKRLNMKRPTLYRLIKEYESKKFNDH